MRSIGVFKNGGRRPPTPPSAAREKRKQRPLLLLLTDLRLPRRILAAGRCGAGLDLVLLRLLCLAVAALLSLGHDVVSSWVSNSSACEIGAAMVAGHDDETHPPEPLKDRRRAH